MLDLRERPNAADVALAHASDSAIAYVEKRWLSVAAAAGLDLPSYAVLASPEGFSEWASQISLVAEIESRGRYLQCERDKANRLAHIGEPEAAR